MSNDGSGACLPPNIFERKLIWDVGDQNAELQNVIALIWQGIQVRTCGCLAKMADEIGDRG